MENRDTVVAREVELNQDVCTQENFDSVEKEHSFTLEENGTVNELGNKR